MCGIAGIFSREPRPASFWKAECLRFSAGMSRRGPDDEGFVLFRPNGSAIACGGDDTDPAAGLPHINELFGDFSAALIHRRLSIIGLGVTGHQPFRSEDGGLWMTYNGECFNFREIDRSRGFSNISGTDTETLIKLWQQEGSAAVNSADGFYAFAVYQPAAQMLYLRRDPTGVKPLYISESDGLLRFCSDAAVLAKSGGIPALDPLAVWHVLNDGVFIPGQELYQAVEPVRDGLDVDLRSFERTQIYAPEPEDLPDPDLRATLERSVSRRLISDVPLGFAVSGGLDSAAIIGLARKQLGPDVKLKLFSVTSSDPGSDESSWQREVAEYNQAEWHSVNISAAGPHLLEEVATNTGLPPVAWNNLAHYELCRLTAQHGVTVIFNGQGADELFGGYPDYLSRDAGLWMQQLFSRNKHWPLKPTDAAGMWLRFRLQGMMPGLLSGFVNRQSRALLHPVSESGIPFTWQLAHLGADRKMAADYYGQRLDQMLMWEDRNGMAHSLESRNPFADDRDLAKWLNVPLKNKLTGGYTKGVLRDALKDVVPESVRWRVDKKGFTVPDTDLTWQHRHAWEPLFMSSVLDDWSPRNAREKWLKNLNRGDGVSLRWYFRLSAFSAFLNSIRS